MASLWVALLFIYAATAPSLQVNAGALSLQECPEGEKGDKGEPGMPGPIGTRGRDGRPGFLGLPGPKGEQGFPGPTGLTGMDGEKGDRGYPGIPGPVGMTGEKGDSGLEGPLGLRGIPGMPGPKGEMGIPGMPGRIGLKGEAGLPGAPGLDGPTGAPGLPGLDGYCPSTYLEVKTPNVDIADGEFGSFDNPSKVLCKDATTETENGKYYYVGPGKIKVNCKSQEDKILTCIPPKDRSRAYFSSEINPYWLSSKGLTVEQLYGLTSDQIAWVQDRSNSVFQKIKYHCVNTIPNNVSDLDHSTLLLSWNDITFGPTSSDATPLTYSIPPESDGCSNGGVSSIIEIKSDVARRLPVIDFLIRDLRGIHAVIVEHLELCYF